MSTVRKLRQRLFRIRPDDQLPLTIEHQRIYVLPTARGCAFIGALLLMLVASVNYALSLGYALCFLLTGLFMSALLHTYRNMAGMRVVSINASPDFAGADLPFEITIDEYRGSDRHAIKIERSGATEPSSTAILQAIEGGASGSTVLMVASQQRGLLTLGRLTLSSTWPLGLWRSWSYLHCQASVIVWPQPEEDAPPLPVQASDVGSGLRRRSEEGDVAGLRDWQAGDPPSRIIWKRVARGGELQVRLQDAPSQPAQTDLDLGTTRLNAVEAQLSRLAAWVLAAELQGSDYGLHLPAKRLAAGRGRLHREQSLEALAVHGIDLS